MAAPVNNNLAEYHVPVNPDIGGSTSPTLGIPDKKFNPLGARGIGEIGITGVWRRRLPMPSIMRLASASGETPITPGSADGVNNLWRPHLADC